MPDPHIYPDPQLAALTLPAAAGVPAPTLTPIEQLAAPDPSTTFIPKTMFIRIAMSGAVCATVVSPTAPLIFLKADTGDPVLLNDHAQPPNQTHSIYHAPGTGLADYVADGLVILESNNVFKVTVSFQDLAGNFSWRLGIWNNDPGLPRDFTWVVSATLANTAQPWIDIEPPTLSWDVLINGSAGESVQISNKGTAAFTVTALAPALPASFALGALPAGPLNPGASAPLTVTFTGPAAPPPPNGVTAASSLLSIAPLDLTAGTSVGHNGRLSVSATTQALEVVLLLDDSGSMSWDPSGGFLPPGSPLSRWSELADAVNNHFLNLLGFFGEARGKFSISKFPPTDPLNPATYDLLSPPVGPIPNVAGMGTAQAAVAAVTPFNGTPMGDGIDHVFSTPTSHFATDALSINANRRWLLLMTDGAWNTGTHNPLEFILPPNGTAAAGTSLSDKKVQLFAIGYGVMGHSDVNPVVLQNLSSGSFLGGQVRRPDDAGLTATQVASAFRDAIKAGITPASSPGDPPAVFHGGQAEARHFALINHYDKKVAFVLSWNTPDAKRMRLELITPTCDLLTPETAGQGKFKDVIFRSSSRSQMYLVGPDFLRNIDDPARPRFGTWTLRVLSPPLTDTRQGLENYDYDIIVDSDLRMVLKPDRSAYFAGDAIRVSARITASGKPVTGASVTLSTTAPLQSEANWLAGLNVPPAFIEKAQSLVKGDSTAILIKSVGAGLAGMTFQGGSAQTGIAMNDPRGIGTYEATITDTSTPEMYTFYVTATGVTEDGVAFRREGKVATHVLVRPEPAFTRVDLSFVSAGVVDVAVTPRDRFGNVLLVDPITTNGIVLTAQGAEFAGPLTSNVDGTYHRQLRYNPTSPTVVTVSFGGQAIRQVNVPPVASLQWVDRVARFVAGTEAAKGANKHTDPNAVLGDIFKGPPDRFLSLGGGGHLIVGINKSAIAGGGPNDLTVFVPPGSDPCAYLVEVYVPPTTGPTPAPAPSGWLKVGTSSGGTQSFSLRNARVALAAAIRITDLSKRTRRPDFQPLSAPGVSIRGVGVLKTTDQFPWGQAWLANFLANPPE